MVGTASSVVPAPLGPRIVAYLIDTAIVLGAAIVWGILVGIGGSISDGAAGLVAFLGFLAFMALIVWNFIIRQGNTGQTVGKQTQNVKLVDLGSGQPVGVGKALVRAFLPGILGTLTFGIFGLLDILWPFFDQNRQRIIDKIISANVAAA